ncbi:methyl-accepting chemotaxis protein [Dongia deserti]|uniref:methyl-accepting chemotaxis protein n=1 Tax=Dongia deserti TaxID=2268030 RepID=UPI000E65A3DB|nr:methyl-accepting chemotaxis protein [Dongia deserti]
MFKSLTIRRKFYGFGGLMAAIALFIGAIGYWGISRQSTELDSVATTSLALRNHLESDMMHDALRADILTALRAARDSNADDMKQAKADLADHSQNFRDRIAANKELAVSAEVRGAISEVEPKLDTYIRTAESLMALAEKDSAAAEAQYAPFLATFEELEDSLGKLSDLISASAQSANESAQGTAALAGNGLIAVIVLAMVLLAGLVFVMVRSICAPLDVMTGAMGTLASGNLDIKIPALGRKDEIGNMAAAMQVFKDNAVRAERLAAERRKEQEAKAKRAEKLEQRTAAFDRSVTTALTAVTTATGEMEANAAALSATAEQTSRQANIVSAASEEATNSVQTVAAATEQLSGSISEISRQVGQSADIASKAAAEAERTNEQVRSLADAAQKIGEVVRLISDIANQTNLLALNATIEAARAGEAGKGFAVVASEVKNLANQTGRATEEISAQIASIQNATSNSVEAIQGITTIINEINHVAASIASAVEEQGAATREIARNIQQAAAGTQDVSSNITGVTQAAGDTGHAAGQMLAATKELGQQSETLRSEVDRFLRDIKVQ